MERDLLSGIGFAAKAEAARQIGNLDQAKRIVCDGLQAEPASLAGRIVLASVLFDLGAADEAQAHLETALASLPGFEAELILQRSAAANFVPQTLAVTAVHADEDEVAYASPVVATEIESALAAEHEVHAELDAAHFSAPPLAAVEEVEVLNESAQEVGVLSEPFATGTVARLLEEQGHLDAAQEIRAVISQKNPAEAKTQDAEVSSRDKIVATLEHWLQNLRGGMQ